MARVEQEIRAYTKSDDAMLEQAQTMRNLFETDKAAFIALYIPLDYPFTFLCFPSDLAITGQQNAGIFYGLPIIGRNQLVRDSLFLINFRVDVPDKGDDCIPIWFKSRIDLMRKEKPGDI